MLKNLTFISLNNETIETMIPMDREFNTILYDFTSPTPFLISVGGIIFENSYFTKDNPIIVSKNFPIHFIYSNNITFKRMDVAIKEEFPYINVDNNKILCFFREGLFYGYKDEIETKVENLLRFRATFHDTHVRNFYKKDFSGSIYTYFQNELKLNYNNTMLYNFDSDQSFDLVINSKVFNPSIFTDNNPLCRFLIKDANITIKSCNQKPFEVKFNIEYHDDKHLSQYTTHNNTIFYMKGHMIVD